MAVLTLFPFTDIRDCDVRDTLNYYGGKVANLWPAHYSQRAAINPYSRYKPVPSSVQFFSLAEWLASGYKGADMQCGLTIPSYSTAASLQSALVNGSALWSYHAPNGTTETFRTGDWRGYYPGAINPIGSMASTYILRSETSGFEFDINVDVLVTSEDDDYNLGLADLSVGGVKLSDMYLGVYLVGENKTFFRTGSTPVGGDGLSVTLKGDSGTPGTYTAYLFLSSKPQLDSLQYATLIGVNKRGQKIVIKDATEMRMLTVNAWWVSNSQFQYEVYATNLSSTSVAYQDVKLNLVRATTSDGEPDFEGIFSDDIAEVARRWDIKTSVNVPGNTKDLLIASGTLDYVRRQDYAYGVFASSETPVYRGEVSPMDEGLLPEGMTLDLMNL